MQISPYPNLLRGHADRRMGGESPGRPRVLIVEDEALIAFDLERRLVRMGFDPVGVADNRDDALDVFRKVHPDLVLMDISIRGPVDGVQTARDMLDYADTAVVFLTAYADDATVARAAELSPYGYLAKPFDDRTLSATCKVAATRHLMDRDLRVLSHVALKSSIGVVVVEVVGDERPIIFANDAFARMSGRPYSEILSSRSCFPTHGESVPAAERLAGAVSRLEFGQETIHVPRPGDDGWWALANVSPVVGPTGRATHVLILFADVSIERKAQHAIAEMQKAELVGRYSASICHDFNNFLSIVLSYANLARQAATEPDLQHDIDQIIKAAEEGVGLTNRLAEFARHDERTIGESSDLADVLQGARAALKTMAGSRCPLRLLVPPHPVRVRLSSDSIEQIMLNLVANARDAMPDGGRIVVRSSVLEDEALSPVTGRTIRIEVVDTGSGIDPAIADRVFEPFFSTKKHDVGRGIGLARCRMLVERAGGSIRLQSVPGRGTTVVVDLPVVEVLATVPMQRAPTPNADNAHGASCVLAIPEDTLRHAYAVALTQAGFAVTEASTGREAREALDVLGPRLDLLISSASLRQPQGGAGGDSADLGDLAAHALAVSPRSCAIVVAEFLESAASLQAQQARVLWMPLSGAVLVRHALDMVDGRQAADPQRLAEGLVRTLGIAPPAGDAAAPARAAQCTETLEALAAPSDLAAAFDESLRAVHVLFQPIVSSETGTPFGYEALMRSRGPLKSPGVLIEAAERLGRVKDLGREVRRRIAIAIDDNPSLTDSIFVNLHLQELQAGILTREDEPLLRYAARIVWEVTERERVTAGDDLARTLSGLRSAGFRIAIDDLGNGYASLSSLVALEPDVAKIDMSLVRNIDRSRIRRDLVAAIVNVCRRVGTLVVAEGVETMEEAAVLRDLHCDFLQGYLFARPAPPFIEP